MTMIVPVNITCPVCDTTFNAQVLASTSSIGVRTTDLRSLAAGFQPQAYLVHSCPSCGYSGYADRFTSRGRRPRQATLDAAIVARVRESITPLLQDREIDPPRRWELASWVAEWQGAAAKDLGWYNLNAAWCCGDLRAMDAAAREAGISVPLRHTLGNEHLPLDGDAIAGAGSPTTGSLEDRERQYRLRAAAEFERALATGEIPEDDRERYTYLIGELYRRVGDADAAGKWFGRISDGGSEWAALAGRQMSDPADLIEQD